MSGPRRPPLAAIDLGSNTVRLLVAGVDPRTGLDPGWGEQVVARLGEGVARHGTLAEPAMERTLAVVRRYRDRARELGAERVLVVATAAVRQAANGPAFLARLAAEPGLAPRVASGEEEARLTLLGALWGLGGIPGRYCLMDLGGGSTELVVADGARARAALSLPLGVVALAERFLHRDPPDRSEYGACADHVSQFLAAVLPGLRSLQPGSLVGTAGTVTTLAALDLGLERYDPGRVQGHRLGVAAIEALLGRLGALSHAARARLPCVEAGRADVILPGIAVVLGVMRGLRLGELIVADSGFREGILLDAAGWEPAAWEPAALTRRRRPC